MAKAKLETPCTICRRMISPGEEITKYRHGSAHESCVGRNYSETWTDYVQSKRHGRRKPGRKFR